MQFPEAQMTMLISCNIENNKYKPQRIFHNSRVPKPHNEVNKRIRCSPKGENYNCRVQVNSNVVPVSIKEVLGNKFR